ncbi:hypothetical protein M9H77_17485 [Catharanthus roseus]|uniref:Uncharacterized protein n=1 Tax=Catharanthus roseus TaxID=4058 RepID=A0ACC0B4T2_CATRO|nr:hypothetical protein M9H77_17485 [Catharanthus roseus]
MIIKDVQVKGVEIFIKQCRSIDPGATPVVEEDQRLPCRPQTTIHLRPYLRGGVWIHLWMFDTNTGLDLSILFDVGLLPSPPRLADSHVLRFHLSAATLKDSSLL